MQLFNTFTESMRNLTLFILLFVAACKPYKDPDPITDPRLTNPYCNDPSAVNYNWDFPGVPDNSVCFYPSDVFAGQYIWRDTVLDNNLLPISFDSTLVTITKTDTTRLAITGKCNTLNLTATRFLSITIDSVIGNGQQFCRMGDTIVGNGIKSSVADTTSFTINYVIYSDTGNSTHKAYFLKQ